MSQLCERSDRMTIAMINGLFDEHDVAGEDAVFYDNREFVDDVLDLFG